MQLKSIDFSKLTQLPISSKHDGSKLYKGDNLYYKLFTGRNSSNYIQDGLDFVWIGRELMSVSYVGLINSKVCPALVDFIHDGTSCVGYVMHEGKKLDDQSRYEQFVDVLVEHSLNVGYAIVDVSIDNVILFQDKPCLIDLNFHPIKIRHRKQFNQVEFDMWEETFSCTDKIYSSKIIANVLAQGKQF